MVVILSVCVCGEWGGGWVGGCMFLSLCHHIFSDTVHFHATQHNNNNNNNDKVPMVISTFLQM